MRLIPYLFFVCLVCCNVALAQELDKAKINTSLNDQFDELMRNSNTYNLHKAVREDKLVTLGKAIADTLSTKNEAIYEGVASIKLLNAKITEQENGIVSLKEELEISQSQSDGIMFLGTLMLKKNFTIIFWLATSFLVIALGIVLILFKNSNVVTVRSVKTLQEVEAELKAVRHNALEKEMKLKRELQTERNKLIELDFKKVSV